MPRDDGLDELLPPEPDDEPEEDTPELDPRLWDDEPALEGELDRPEPDDDEDLLPNEALEDDRWWPPEPSEDDLEIEPLGADLTEELPLGVEDDGRWQDLEDESRYAPDRLVRLGWRERALLLDHGLEVYAVCDTASAISKVRARMLGREGDRARVELDGRELEVSVIEEGGVLQLRLRVQIAGVPLEAALVYEREVEGDALVLGRDLLAGRFLVDVSVERPVML